MVKGKITLIYDNSGDWVGIYVDGKLKAENHNYQEDDLLAILEIDCDVHWVDMESSRLPAKLEDVKIEKPYVFDPEKCKDGKPHQSIMGSEFCLGCGESL